VRCTDAEHISVTDCLVDSAQGMEVIDATSTCTVRRSRGWMHLFTDSPPCAGANTVCYTVGGPRMCFVSTKSYFPVVVVTAIKDLSQCRARLAVLLSARSDIQRPGFTRACEARPGPTDRRPVLTSVHKRYFRIAIRLVSLSAWSSNSPPMSSARWLPSLSRSLSSSLIAGTARQLGI
jgi:hypothetical protein